MTVWLSLHFSVYAVHFFLNSLLLGYLRIFFCGGINRHPVFTNEDNGAKQCTIPNSLQNIYSIDSLIVHDGGSPSVHFPMNDDLTGGSGELNMTSSIDLPSYRNARM